MNNNNNSQNLQLANYSTFNNEINEDLRELPLEEEIGNKSENKVSFWYDKYNILLLFSIYAASGLGFGYFESSLTVILTKAGASYSQLSLISFVIYPFSFKFIWAPLCDAYYLPVKFWMLGKRKTYIVLSCYFCGIILFISAFYINSWVASIQANILTIIGFLLITLLTFESIGTDAWSVAILHPDNISYASMALNAGEDFGAVISYNMFIWLNLRGGDTLQEQIDNEIISSKTLFFIISCLFLLIAFIIHYFTIETTHYSNEFDYSLKKVLIELKGFFKNSNLLFLSFIFIFSELSFALVDNGSSILLIQKNFSTDLIDFFDLMSTFVGMSGYLISAYFCKQKKEWSLYLVCMILRFLLDISLFFIVVYYDKQTNNTIMILFYGIQVNLYSIIADCYSMAMYGFVLRISEGNLDIGASFITILACVSNFGSAWTNTLAIWLLEYWNFTYLTYVTWIYGVIFYGFLWKKIRNMENINQENWKVHIYK